MDYKEYRQIRDRYDFLIQALRAAEAYERRYGPAMQTKAAMEHRMNLRDAKVELPSLTEKLIRSWQS
jgi:hypothetical protein